MNNSENGYASNSCPTFNPEQARMFCNFLFSEGCGCLELRVLDSSSNRKVIHVGYYNDVEKLIRDASRFNGRGAIYVGLNLRKDVLLHALKANTLTVSNSAGDTNDVLAVEMFPIDLDTIRPSKKVASSDEELQKARLVFEQIYKFLVARGVKPIRAFSGNGYHLIIPTIKYHVDRTKEKNSEFALLLRYFGRMFSNEYTEVDLGVFDPPRIWKLYGSASIKGANTIDRPWRSSSFMPEDLVRAEKYDILEIFRSEIELQMKHEKVAVSKRQNSSIDLVNIFKELSDVHS